MSARPLVLLCALSLSACQKGSAIELADTGGEEAASADGGATGDAVDSGATGGAVDSGTTGGTVDSGTTGGGDTGGDTGPIASPVSAVSWALHPDIATLIEVQFTLDASAEEVWLAWTTDGSSWSTSPARSLDAGEHSEVILGLPSETALRLEVRAVRDGVESASEALDALTGPLPADLREPIFLGWDEKDASPEGFLYTSVEVGGRNFFGPYYPVILNREGQIVWYYPWDDYRLSMLPRVAPGGTHVMVDKSTIYVGGTPELLELTLDRRMERATTLPSWGLAYDKLPDGSVLYEEGTTSTQSYLTRIAPDGSAERIWDCKAWMSRIQNVGYWDCKPNSILWYPDTDTALWSMFETSTVVEIDMSSGEVVRQFGQLPGSWDFDPPDAGMELQHFPNYTEDGTLIISTHALRTGGGAGAREQWVREYSLDEAEETLTQIWSYQNDLGYYAEYAGEAKRLSSGNTLMGLGTDGAILEVTPDGDVVWGVEWPNKLLGQATLIDDLYALNEGW